MKDIWKILKQAPLEDWLGCISIFVTFFVVLTWVSIGMNQ